VTMVTTPKSAGVSRRARITVLITWAARVSPEADTVAAALRMARRRNSWLPALGWKAPLESNGIIRLDTPCGTTKSRYIGDCNRVIAPPRN
jgi:hypothetical protein